VAQVGSGKVAAVGLFALFHDLPEAGEVVLEAAEAVVELAQFLLEGGHLLAEEVGAAIGEHLRLFEAFYTSVGGWIGVGEHTRL